MTVEVQTPMKLNQHQAQILLKGQTTGVGVDPMQFIMKNNGSYTPKYESDEDDSSSPSPHPSRTEVTYYEVKSETGESVNQSQPTYRLLQPSGILDARQILQSHGLFEANQAASNYPVVTSAGVATVLLPSEANLPHNLSATRSIAGMGDLSSVVSVYSPQTNGQIPQVPNSASSDSCSSDITSQKPFIYAKPPTSPSPYTANTERARSFNAYVKQLIESRMDCKIPISLQPKHLVDDIMNDAKKHFPEFESCTRKRIRTFLKSCRRSKKFRQQIGDEYSKRPDSSLNISPALGSSPDLTQIRPITASGQTLIMPQFITHIPNSSALHRSLNLPQTVPTLNPSGLLLNSQNNTTKVSTVIPIAQHQFNTDSNSLGGNSSPTHSDPSGFHSHNRRSSDSDDDDEDDINMGGNNSEPDNASTRPSTPPSLPLDRINVSIPSSLQLPSLHNSRAFMSSPFLHQLNGTTKLQQQIPVQQHLLTSQGQIMHTKSESLSKLSSAAHAQVNLVQNRKRPSPTIEDSQNKRLNGEVRSSLLNALPALSGLSSFNLTNPTISGNLGEYPNFPNGAPKLSESELRDIQGMIDGYRQSATFLNRAALQLEKFLQSDVCKTENIC